MYPPLLNLSRTDGFIKWWCKKDMDTHEKAKLGRDGLAYITQATQESPTRKFDLEIFTARQFLML